MQQVIVVTGNCSIDEAVCFMREGAADFIQRPVDLLTLENSVSKVISASATVDPRALDIESKAIEESISYVLTSAEAASTKLTLKLADKLYEQGRISLNVALQLKLAFQEAIANSLDHGNLELKSSWKEELDASYLDRYSQVKRDRLADPHYAGRKIEIRMAYDAHTFSIRIKDSGPGFDFHKVLQSQAEIREDLVPHGRGLAMMFVSMNEVTFSDSGREILMVKYLTDEQPKV